MSLPLRQKLLSLQERDLATRRRLLRDGSLFDGYHPEMEAVHCDHARQLDRILDEHGWPGISRVGEAGEAAAWMIAQHAISMPALQHKSLACLAEAVSRGDAPAWHQAFLQDRILANQEKPQLYGAIWDWDENGELSTRVDDWSRANERRRRLGLPPLEESMEEHRKAAAAEGAVGPKDSEEHRKKRRRWARRVGWL